MGQIIRLPVFLAEYPDTSTALDPAECVLLSAIRWWVADCRQRDDPLPRLCQAMGTAGVHDAAFSVDKLMAVFVRSARRPMAIHCPRCPGLSEDEKHWLNAASLVQAGESEMAERVLRTALLSAQGAEFALGPLRGLSELFTEARLFLRRRRSPAAVETPTAAAAPGTAPSATGNDPLIDGVQ
jgi:hypothetical protein